MLRREPGWTWTGRPSRSTSAASSVASSLEAAWARRSRSTRKVCGVSAATKLGPRRRRDDPPVGPDSFNRVDDRSAQDDRAVLERQGDAGVDLFGQD